MFATVEIPYWLLVLVLLFAGIAALDRVLMPSARWYLRRRLERAVERLNQRLSFPIQPFKLARRNDTILRLRFDPEVAKAVLDYARENNIREDVAAQKAERYAREIVPSFSAFTYFAFAIRAARLLSRSLYRVRVGTTNADAIEAISKDSTVIFVMNHRSNMDYVLVTWLAADRSALAYAVGEWARVWPLQPLIRMLGGYFIRRRYNNALYRKVLARYVQMATEAGVTQAVFPEGGLSRTGAMRDPKVGLLSYIVEGFNRETSRDVVFVPVALNYDRVMEDRNLIRAQNEGTRPFRFSIKPIFRYLRRILWQRVTRRHGEYGLAAVSYGEPLSLSAFIDQHGNTPEALGQDLMGRIGTVMPVVPFPMIAHAWLSGAATRAELIAGLGARIAIAREKGAPVFLPDGLTQHALVDNTLASLKERKMLRMQRGSLDLSEEGKHLLAFYAASVEPIFGDIPNNLPELQVSE